MNTPHPFFLPNSGSAFHHVLLIALLTLAGTPLWGASFTVNTLTDTINGGQGAGANGVGDLRYCLRRVNDSAQGQTHAIIFAPGLSGKITLKGSELIIRNNVTITGPGKDQLTVDGDVKSRILYIEGGHQVQISGLTLTAGNGAGKDPTGTDPHPYIDDFGTQGGAVLNHGSVLTLRDCSITASSSGSGGGGIFNYAENSNSTLTLIGCSITNNSVTSGGDVGGGGILNYAVNDNNAFLNASACIISGNSTGVGGGGGISSRGIGAIAKAELSQCSITDNTSAGYYGGGGIWSSGQGYRQPTTMLLTGCVVANNTHTSSWRGTTGEGGGGGIFNGGAELQWSVMNLRGCVISGNKSAISGGGICNSATTNLNRSELSLSQCSIHHNEAGGSGGGISNFAFQGEAYLDLGTCTVALNKAQLRGGGIANMLADTPYNDPGDVAETKVSGSTIAGNSANAGAGIYSVKPQLYQDQTTVRLKLTSTLIGLQGEGANLLVTRGSNVSGGYNLCDDDTGAFLNNTGDMLGISAGLSSIIGENGQPVPLLQDNNGSTPTIALLTTSPAIDAGKATPSPADSTSMILDQRGLARIWDNPDLPNAPGGDGSDIGAFEGNSPVITGWRYRYFGLTDNSGNAADQADPNRNGIPNLIEYALHGDPISTAGGKDLLPKITTDGITPPQFTLMRYPDRPGTIMTVQAATSLSGPWENVARSVDGLACQALASDISVMDTGPANSPAVTITGFNPSLPRQFFRLSMEAK